MMGTRRAVFAFFKCGFVDLRRSNKLRQPGTFYRLGNLKPEHRSFVQNVDRRWMSLASQPLPDVSIKKFLDNIIKAYTNGTSTEFDKVLQNKSVIKLINERLKMVENIKVLEEFEEEDKEMKKLAEEEKCTYENQLKQIDNELINVILDNISLSRYDDVIFEITAGVGGQEAMLFVKDLLEMYTNHFNYLGFNFEIIEASEASQGGFRHASIMISGKGAFEKLRHEAGVHRVQRVPATERTGRMHTSVVSVAVMPQPSEIDIEINPKDLRIDTMRASGAGGQHVNTTDSAVRIVHLPTGLIVESQTQRSQLKNRETAMAKLRAKLYQTQLEKQLKNATNMRKQQMGMGERNEKIRTYNYNQDRITDHRLSNATLHNLKGFMEGGEALDNLHDKLNQDLRHKTLLEIVKSMQ